MQAKQQRASISRRIVPLRYAADWRSLGFLAALVSLYIVQWIGWARHWSLLIIACALAFVACVIKHNHIHCRTFASLRWNRFLDYALSICTGQPITAIISIHNERHHAQFHTNSDCVRSSLVNFHWTLLNLIAFPLAAVRAVHQNKAADIARWRKEKPKLYRNLIHERIVVVGFVAVLLAINWSATLLYFGVPCLFGQWCIVAINLLQHQDCDHGSTHDHSRNLTGAIVNWIFLNNGYHTAHHLRPALHWSLLAEYHRREIAPKMRADLNEPSLIAFLWRHLRYRHA
jgi:fatty acid desaturase